MSATRKSAPSPARVAANRTNAAKSTGPRTEEGKARSRANAVKHGMVGRVVALPGEDAAALRERALRLHEELAPTTQLGIDLVDDIATASARRERCRRYLDARLRRLGRDAVADFNARRLDRVDRLLAAIEDDPRAHRRQLLTMPEGVDRLVDELLMLVHELTGPLPVWSEAHHRRLDALFGYRVGDLPWVRPTRFSRGLLGDFAAIGPDEYADLPAGMTPDLWVADRLIAAVAAEVARLTAHRATLDPERIEADRVDAADLALFDPDRDAELARRYEATAARERSRVLRDYGLAESFGGSDEDNSVSGNEIGAELASFGAEEGNNADGPDIVAVGDPPRDPGHPLEECNPLPENEMGSDLGSSGAEEGCHAVRYSEPVPLDSAEPLARVRSTEPRGTQTPPLPDSNPLLDNEIGVDLGSFGALQSPLPDAVVEPAHQEEPPPASDEPNSLPEKDKRPDLGSFGAESSAAPAPAPAAEISPARAAIRAAIFDEKLTFIPPLDR